MNTLTLSLTGRIDANNAPKVEAEIADALAKNPGAVPVFDASGLEYISSAGLRVLLKFRKQFGKSLDVIDVSNDVYDIFSVTGFTELLNVRKKLREISIEGCPVISGGGFSTIYRLDAETIVKVFDKVPTPLAKVEADRTTSREVFLHDIPTAIAYDVVRAGNHYGLVYEMIDADTVAGTLTKRPELLEELGLKMARLMKKLHTTEFDAGTFPDLRDFLRGMVQLPFNMGLITAEDKALIDGLIDRIPGRNTFLHLDYHPKNIMFSNNELVLIDVGEAALGHPIADLMMSYTHCVYIARSWSGAGNDLHEKAMGLDHKTLGALWDVIMPEYFGTTDADTLREYEEIISGYSPLMMLVSASIIPIPDELRPSIAAPMMERLRKIIPTLQVIEGI